MFVSELQTELSLYFQPASSHNERICPIHCLKHEISLQAARSSLILTSILKPVSETGRWPFLFPLEHSSSKPQCSVAAFFMVAEASKGLSCRLLLLCALQGVWEPLSIGFTECYECSGCLSVKTQDLVLGDINSALFLACWQVLGQVTPHASVCNCGMEMMGLRVTL